MLKSAAMVKILTDIGDKVMDSASTDSNPEFVDSLRLQVFEASDRAVVQVGAAPIIGMAVEAKRGTLSKALGAARG
jgi:hypothetical protein